MSLWIEFHFYIWIISFDCWKNQTYFENEKKTSSTFTADHNYNKATAGDVSTSFNLLKLRNNCNLSNILKLQGFYNDKENEAPRIRMNA